MAQSRVEDHHSINSSSLGLLTFVFHTTSNLHSWESGIDQNNNKENNKFEPVMVKSNSSGKKFFL